MSAIPGMEEAEAGRQSGVAEERCNRSRLWWSAHRVLEYKYLYSFECATYAALLVLQQQANLCRRSPCANIAQRQ